MANNSKIPGSGLRLLEILKVLTKSPMTIDELLQIVEELDDSIYRKEIVLKYLNTLKAIGFDIIKIKDKYYLENGLNKIDLNETDLSMLLYIEKYAGKLKHEKLKHNLLSSIHTIEKGMSYKTLKLIKDNKIKAYQPEKDIILKDEAIKTYEKYCLERQQLDIKYKSSANAQETHYKVAPLSLIYKRGAAVFIAYDYETKLYKEFLIQNITESKQRPQVSTSSMPTAVTFKLKNRLARSYMPRENEQILESGEDYVIVSNRNEDRDILIKRLLRYYNECEILYPKECRQKIVNLIEEMEKLYV